MDHVKDGIDHLDDGQVASGIGDEYPFESCRGRTAKVAAGIVSDLEDALHLGESQTVKLKARHQGEGLMGRGLDPERRGPDRFCRAKKPCPSSVVLRLTRLERRKDVAVARLQLDSQVIDPLASRRPDEDAPG